MSLNPFSLPGLEQQMQLLCPWRQPAHREYYVAVDSTEQAYLDFIDAMGNLSTLLDHGRLALVTGDSGCGKSALVHRCADWVVRELAKQELKGVVINLSRTLNGRPQESVERRLSAVCTALFIELKLKAALKCDAIEDLQPYNDQPEWFYPHLPSAMNDGQVLIILLPDAGELADEVKRYASLTRNKVLFLVESALLNEHDANRIVTEDKGWAPPITLRVGALRPGDVHLFASNRLKRHSKEGIYPRMSEATLDSVAKLCKSVAQLQKALFETYEARRRSDLQHEEHCWVTEDEIRQQILSWLRRGGRS